MNKLYEDNSHMTSCNAEVTSCVEDNGEIWITLSDTVFFPEEGGQYADTGILKTTNGHVELIDGQIKNGSIVYRVSDVISVGERVECQLDWEKRFSRMQQHSAEHIMSGLIHNKYGFNNVGFHLSDDSPVTMDISGALSAESVYEIEALANKIVTQNLKITASYPAKAELESLEYRSKKEIDGQVRLITVGEGEYKVDVCACCAPHVERTGEIGQIVVVSVQSYKGGTRISILAGERAATYVRDNINILNNIARKMTTSSVNIADRLDKQAEEMSELKQKISQLQEERLSDTIKNTKGDNKCIFIEGQISGGVIKKVMENGLRETEGYLAIFMGDEANGFNYTLGSLNKSAVSMQKLLIERLGAKGGGKEPMVSGRVTAAKEKIKEIFS